jgi:hypothetical protein
MALLTDTVLYTNTSIEKWSNAMRKDPKVAAAMKPDTVRFRSVMACAG